LEQAQGATLEKILGAITNLAHNEQSRISLASSGVFTPLLKRIIASSEPRAVSALLNPILSLLKSSNPDVIDRFVRSGGVEMLMKLTLKLAANMTGSLKSADYELLRSILVTFFLVSVDESNTARIELVNKGFLGACSSISSLILPMDIGTQSILMQLLTNLSCVDAHEIPILESGFLLVAVDHLGSVSDELRARASMLLANLAVNPRVRASIKQFGWDSHILSLLRHPSPEIQRHALRFVVNISANGTCRKLLIDSGVLSHLEGELSHSFASDPSSPLHALLPLALSNLRVPIDTDVAEEFKVETIEIEVESAPEVPLPRSSSPGHNLVSFTSREIQDPFQQLDMELQSYFGPTSGLLAPSPEPTPAAAPVRGRTATMTKDPKDEPMYIRREKIARELFDTEEKYVANLKILLDVFVTPLTQAINDNKPILTHEELTTVFSVIQLIYNLHLSFLSKLRPLFEKWTWSSCIGSLFETLADRLKVYETFVNNYDKALALLESPQLQKRKAFQNFMKEAANKAVGVGYAGISHYLIMPIQRPPRFLMLLGELVKFTPPLHVDMPSLKRSVQKMSALASYLNEARRISETETKVEEITQRFGGPLVFEGEPFDIALPGRVFLKEGSLLEERSHLPKSFRDTVQLGKRDSWGPLMSSGGLGSAPSPGSSPTPDSVLLASSAASMGDLTKASSSNSKMKRTPRYVYLFLFNDTLLIASMQKKILGRQSVMNAKLTLVGVLALSRVAALEPIPDPKQQLKFSLKLKDDSYPIVFAADTELERGEWIQSLTQALKASKALQDQDTQISELDRLIDLL
jgi:hypothetical protein